MKTVVIVSGGLDSTVLLHELVWIYGDEVWALSVNYGQRHVRELDCAARTAQRLGIEQKTLDLSDLEHLLAGSALTSAEVDVPHGHYTHESMTATVVPNRNAILLNIAAGWAISQNASRIAYAAHGGDHAIYPDCRPEFVAAARLTLILANSRPVDIFAPYLDLTKAQIVKRGADMRVDFRSTWSCYQGEEVHCGRCATCVERAEAFNLAGVADPTEYADRAFWRSVTKRVSNFQTV